MSVFGWSYPAGCSGTPFDECPDDSCCSFCGQPLPDAPREEEWAFEGYCDAECAARVLVQRATFTDDQCQHETSQRNTLMRAIEDLARAHREKQR